jgi:hypothetical protein
VNIWILPGNEEIKLTISIGVTVFQKAWIQIMKDIISLPIQYNPRSKKVRTHLLQKNDITPRLVKHASLFNFKIAL